MESLFKVLGDMNRLRILNLVLRNELCVCEIEHILEMSQSNVSRLLSRLKLEKLICCRRKGQWIHYYADAQFLENNLHLVSYLEENFKSDPVMKKDLQKYERCKEIGIGCESLAKEA
mgnify:CR=1 FL=1